MLVALTCQFVNAQNSMDVTSFTRLENDLMARVSKPVRDHDEGKLCALIKVISPFTELEVRPDALGIVQQEKHGGELWLYVPYGARSLSLSVAGYFPVLYKYAEPITEGTVYELRLSDLDSNGNGVAAGSVTQLFALTHNPDEATVYIDDVEQPSENGVFVAMMSKGEHTWKVTAPQFEDAEGWFELEESPVRENVALKPLFGSINVLTLPENDFNIWNGNELLGTSPFKSGRLEPGAYNLRIEKKDYYPVDTLVRLRAGDEISLTCKLTSFADSLFYNRQLGGRRVSLGVKAGYLMPFPVSSAKGGFSGSMINYGFGDERENLKYTSKSGFTAGIIVDIRLVKNFYLLTGIDYMYIKFDNKMNFVNENTLIQTVNRLAYVGNQNNSYKESYTQQLIELPILASYRFVLTRRSSLHINLGPYLSYGLSSKMKLGGSEDVTDGKIYNVLFGEVDYKNPVGTFSTTSHVNGDFNMYSKSQSYTTTAESGMNIGNEVENRYDFKSSPFKRFNCGIRLGATYELSGFQLGLQYDFQVTNMANKDFWESSRVPILGKPGANNMSGYSHRIHSLAVTVGYIFRK